MAPGDFVEVELNQCHHQGASDQPQTLPSIALVQSTNGNTAKVIW